FAGRYAFKDPEDTFTIAPTASRRHAIFEHLNIVNIQHHRLTIAGIAHLLLLDKAVQLIKRIVELREAIAELRPGYDRLKTFNGVWIGWIHLRKRADEKRRIDKPDRSGDILAHILPKLVNSARFVFSLLHP